MADTLSTASPPKNEVKLASNVTTASSASGLTDTNPSLRMSGITSTPNSLPSPITHREDSSNVRRLSSSSSLSFHPSNSSSRRTSLISGIPIYGSHGDRDVMMSSSLGSSGFASGSLGSEIGVGPGPGPQRYPKPKTAADLHLEMEKEQEAVVNRLTRELLRVHSQATLSQQYSPAVSSGAAPEDPPTPASARIQDSAAPPYFIYGGSTTYPRHHRTASATSNTNATAGNLSRQGSMRSIRSVTTGGRNTPPVGETPITFPSSASAALSPGFLPSGWGLPPYAPYGHQHPISATGSELNLPLGDTPGSALRSGATLAETIQLKKQMDQAQHENEELRQKIKALEKELKEFGEVEPEGWGGGSASSVAGGRSRSPSITRSIHRGRTRETKRPAPNLAPSAQSTTITITTGAANTTKDMSLTTTEPATSPLGKRNDGGNRATLKHSPLQV